MKFVALLRGINVGGNNLIKMADLKKAFEELGFRNVSTYIQSGNVIFGSDNDKRQITKILEKELSKKFNYKANIVVRSEDELAKIVERVPKEWNTNNNIRCYVAFVKEPVTPEQVIKEAPINSEVDFIETGPGVVYMTTLMTGLTRSGFSKLIGTKIYKEVTIRNYNTTKKLLEHMK